MPGSKMDQAHPHSPSTRLRIYPDSGATIYLGELSERNLVPSRKKVRTVRAFSLVYQDWLPVTFKVGKKTTKQALYICRKVQVIYFSKATCIDVGILTPCFPKPMTSPLSVIYYAVQPDIQRHKIDPPANIHKSIYSVYSAMLRFTCVRFCQCQNIKLGSYESTFSCIISWITSWSGMQTSGGDILWTLGHSIMCMWLSPFSGQ